MKQTLKNLAAPFAVSAIVVAGLASAAATDAIPNPLPNAVAGNVIKATDINDLSTAVGILDERTDGISRNGNSFGLNINTPARSGFELGSQLLPVDGSYLGLGAYFDDGWRNANPNQGGYVIRNSAGRIDFRNIDSQIDADTVSTSAIVATFTENRNVGIGIANPIERLDVAGAGRFSGRVNDNIDADLTTTVLPNQGAYISWNEDGGSGRTHLSNQRGGGQGGWQFDAYDNTGSFDKTTLEIDSLTGNVQINNLAGTGNAFACVNETGTLYRSATACN